MSSSEDRDPSAELAPWRLDEDYDGALVRLATLRLRTEQHLIFGYVELFPRGVPLPEAFTAGDKPWPVPELRAGTLGYSVIAVAVVEALRWYEAAAGGAVTVPPLKPPAPDAPS